MFDKSVTNICCVARVSDPGVNTEGQHTGMLPHIRLRRKDYGTYCHQLAIHVGQKLMFAFGWLPFFYFIVQGSGS